jgi:molybdate transport repressor ModE-like protein
MPLALPVPDLVSLDLLQSVAELGSIRQAAQAHGISQPAASMRLRSLERALGLELLDRSSGRARLTPSGLAVVEWSDRILEGVRSLVTGTAALRNEGRTQLRIGASMTVAEYLVPRWIDRLRKAEPGLGVSLQMGNSVQVADMVQQRYVDLGFVEGRSADPDLQSRVIEPDDLVVVVAPSHPWARRRRPLSAAMLAATPLVLREVGSGTREVLETALAKRELAVVRWWR